MPLGRAHDNGQSTMGRARDSPLLLPDGEYDALLHWPFKQTVTLMLLDQDKLKDIVQSFRPEPSSSSFQRPRNEMNVASGCPMFAPLSILNNPSYVECSLLTPKPIELIICMTVWIKV